MNGKCNYILNLVLNVVYIFNTMKIKMLGTPNKYRFTKQYKCIKK